MDSLHLKPQNRKIIRFLDSRTSTVLTLALILLIGGYFRLIGLNWDTDQHLQPDERFMTMVAEQIHSVSRLSDYFDPETSPLNPLGYGFYTYGMLPLFVTRYAAEALAMTGYDEIVLVGRSLSATFDLAAVLLLYLLGQRLYGRWTGLLAAALYAAAVLPIQLSHFFAVDSFTTLFMLAAFYAAVLIIERPSYSAFTLFGVANGLALTTKVSIAPLALVAVAAAAAHMISVWSDRRQRMTALRRTTVGLLIAGLYSGIVFRLFQPYAFAGPSFFDLSFNPRWLEIVREVSAQVDGQVDFPPSHHWAGRPWGYAWNNLVRWGMGFPLGIIATVSWFCAACRLLRGHWRRHLLPVLWTGGFFLWQNSHFWRYNRYFLPIYPLAILLAAWLLATLVKRANWRTPRLPHLPPWHRLLLRPLNLASLLVIGVLLGTLLYAFAFTRIYTRPHTRVVATEWLRKQVPGPLNIVLDTDGGRQSIPLPVPYDMVFDPGDSWTVNFVPPEAGTLIGIGAPNVQKGVADSQSVSLEWTILTLDATRQPLAQQVSQVDFTDESHRVALEVDLPGIALEAGQTYDLAFRVLEGTPVSFGHVAIAVESSWDDALPLRTPGFDPYGGIYRQLDLGLFQPDDAEKRERIIDMLSESAYLVVSSNRVYDAAPRLPLRYPLTLAYYQALFDCDTTQITQCAYPAQPGMVNELGFELAAVFESYPSLGPFVFPDQEAMESFTVYDHPKVFIFRKLPSFSPTTVAGRFVAVELDQVIAQSASQNTIAPNALRLSEERWHKQKAGGTWAEMFSPDAWLNQSQVVAVIVWYLLLTLLGWLVYPLLYVLFPGLALRGYGLARLLSLMLTGWLAWLAGSLQLLPFTRGTLLIAILLISTLSGVLAWRQRRILRQFVRDNWRHLLFLEGLFGLLFLLALLLRVNNPDLWHPWRGGEKPGELAMFSAVLKSVHFPPYEPWLAGHQINYYYFGYVLAAVPTKLLGMLPSLAFNLLLPTWFAMTGVGLFTAAFNLASLRSVAPVAPVYARSLRVAYIVGLIALVMGLLLGNLYQVRLLWHRLPDLAPTPGDPSGFLPQLGDALSGLSRVISGETDLFQGDYGPWYFQASRAILNGQTEAPITEFPLFTFLYGDLHPHLLDMPIVLAALAWMIGILQTPKIRDGGRLQGILSYVTGLSAGAFIIGATYATNTWDYPVMLSLGAVAIGVAAWVRRTPDLRKTGWLMGSRILLLALLSAVLYAPFRDTFAAGQVALQWWSGPRTPLFDYFIVHGLFLFVILSYLVLETTGRLRRANFRWRQPAADERISDRRSCLLAVGILTVIGLSVLIWAWNHDFQTATVALILTIWSGGLSLSSHLDRSRRAALVLIGGGLGLTFLVELITLSGDVGRMNVVFKSYLLVWFFFSVATAVLLANLWRRLAWWNWRWLWLLGLELLLLGTLTYPLTGISAKLSDRWPGQEDPPRGLDGLAFLKAPIEYMEDGQSISLDVEYAAIRWTQANLSSTPTIVEGHTPEYRWGARFASHTGLPTVVGWNWHLRQRNGVLPPSLVEDRIGEVAEFYSTLDRTTALQFLKRYQVDYVIVGQLERALYDGVGLLKFEQMAAAGRLTAVYPPGGESGPVTIYRVLPTN